MQEVYRYSN